MMKDIIGFEGLYSITDQGNVWSYYTNKFLKPVLGANGYLKVTLVKDGKKYTKAVHRLVAETFILNPDNLSLVNHKDENKMNNSVDNLEWCNHLYNSNYGTHPER